MIKISINGKLHSNALHYILYYITLHTLNFQKQNNFLVFKHIILYAKLHINTGFEQQCAEADLVRRANLKL